MFEISNKTAIPYSIEIKKIHDLDLNIPNIDSQNKVVNILDNFSTITKSITNGLPNEIKLRQQQYEYYRDKIFSVLSK